MRAKGFKRVFRRKKPKADKPVFVAFCEAEVAGEGEPLLRDALADRAALLEPEPARTSLSDVSLAAAVEAMKKPQALSKTRADYERAWAIERAHRYKVMDALEERYGYKIGTSKLNVMALAMACPIKRNAPNWQHGRLVYALAAHRAAQGDDFVMLDIGSAKGFSATCMALAVDAVRTGLLHIWSVDIIDPASTAPRNSMLDDIVKRGIWDYCEQSIPEAMRPMVHFVQDGDAAHIGFLSRTDRIGFAFVDGGHSYDDVRRDIINIVPRQQAGDIILFDDMQLPDVRRAVEDCLSHEFYSVEHVSLIPSRSYAIAVRQ